MNLDEAIQHAKDKSKQLEGFVCGQDHAQLAVWLEELKSYHEKGLALKEFSHEDLLSIADGLDTYEKTVNVGDVEEKGVDVLLESGTAAAARFIRLYVNQAIKSEPQTKYVFRRVIVAAACKYGDVIITGARHYDRVMHGQLKAFPEDHEVRMMNRGEVIQGFIDNQGTFLNREEALLVAKAANQIRFKHEPDYELFSEDLY